jgi:ATP-binding cassette subfamily F protein uup
MAAPLLHLRNIALTFGGPPLLVDAEIAVSAGERVCLVGRNGSGKSTLLKMAAGLVEPDKGTRFVQPGATVRYLPQEPDFTGFSTTLAYVEGGLGPGDDLYRARYLVERLGLTGEEGTDRLSGGEARRAALARVLAPDPDIMLLDEPTNHLDLPAIEWLEDELKSSRSALVIISHDRRFLENLSRATVWLDRGVTRRIDRGFAHFEEWRDQVFLEEELERERLAKRIEAEEHWMRYGVTARRKRNQRRVAELGAMRTELREGRRAAGSVAMTLSEGETSGKLVIEAVGVSKSYDGRDIVRDFSIRIARGDRIGIVGPNGAGKTTLLNLLTGALAPDAGTVKLGTNLDMVTLDQRRESLDPSWTVAEALTGGRGDTVMVNGQPKHVVGYMKDFLFGPEQIRTAVNVLSGGERGRLMLARALAKQSNLLVLDEPTNDLDLETLDLLQETIGDYDGTVLLISHDRDFLDRIVNSVIMAEADGRWTVYAGGYTDMLSQRGVGVTARIAAKEVRKAERDAASTPAKGEAKGESKRRLTFNEQHALKTLPKTMAELEAKLGKLQAELDDPALYARDPSRFQSLMTAMTETQTALNAAEEQWLTLEMLREEIGG